MIEILPNRLRNISIDENIIWAAKNNHDWQLIYIIARCVITECLIISFFYFFPTSWREKDRERRIEREIQKEIEGEGDRDILSEQTVVCYGLYLWSV